MGKRFCNGRESNSQNVSSDSNRETKELEENPIQKHPVDKSNLWSFSTFSWMSSLMYFAYKNDGLDLVHIPAISEGEACRQNTEFLEQLWTREMAFADLKSNSRVSFGRVIWLFVRGRILLTTLVFLTSLILGFIGPTMLMKRVLEFSSTEDSNWQEGVIWVVLLIICELARVLFFTLTWALSYRTALRLKSASMGLVYRKLLRLGHSNDSIATKLLNVINSDCSRVYDVIISGQVAIGGPVVLVLSVGYIVYELGWVSLLGLVVFPLSYPVQYLLAKGSGSFKRKAIHVKDDRVKFISQATHYLKFLKMFSWEKYFENIISNVRQNEKNYLQKSQLLQSFSIVIGPTLPHVGAIITFILYINSGHDLTPAQCFTILFLFSLFGYTIRSFSQIFEHYYNLRIYSRRMVSVLTLPEIIDGGRGSHGSNHDSLNAAVVCEEVTITRRTLAEIDHGDESKKISKKNKQDRKEKYCNSIEKLLGSESDTVSFQLSHINLSIDKGRFVGICGHIGSGKTTFLEAIAGSLQVDKGILNVYGRIAYAPQEPWIFKGTVRDNVTFGDSFDSVRYYNTIDACCLVNDFAVLPAGDLTITADNGSNLSGGQRQRIGLARAIYHASSRDIFLLDDTFSGLDGRVAKTIYERIITNLLRAQQKTIVMVTHQMQLLHDCDEILVFNEGTVVERGTHDQLMAIDQSRYSELMASSSHAKDASHENVLLEDSTILDCQLGISPNDNKSKPENSKAHGSIPRSVYKLYIDAGGGIITVLLLFLVFGLSIGMTAFSSWWLKNWFKAPGLPPIFRSDLSSFNETNSVYGILNSDGYHNSTGNNETIVPKNSLAQVINSQSVDFEFNRNVYAGIIGAIFLTSFIRTLFFVFASIKASQGLHRKLLSRFFGNRLKSSERIGSGQILNLFSRDVEEIDVNLPNTLELFLQNIFIVLSVFTLVSLVFPSFLGPLVLLFIIFVVIRRVYNVAIRDLKRLESEARSPIFTLVAETLTGLATIRAFGKERYVMENFETITDSHHSIFYTFNSAVRWLSIRLDVLAVSVTGITAILILLFHGSVSAAACGLALSYAAQLSGIFQFTVRLASETEARFVSVERMDTFLRYSQPEKPDSSDDDKNQNLVIDDLSATALHPNWPYAGHVKFVSASLTYSEDLLPALRDVSFEVQPGQNIGIIGRTGSGKSSIGSALFRLLELKSGQIFLDDIDISTISLDKLRNSLCVIPQDPAIFQHNIRFNLDPGKLHTDEELWKVLEKTGLKSVVDSLDNEVGLSQGQKQLLSIARALLRQSKVVFVDEATSNVDVETSLVVDCLLAEEFQSSTVFIVAHRLSALSFCDYLLIMEDGEVRDFGPVEIITRKPEFVSHFERFDSVSLL